MISQSRGCHSILTSGTQRVEIDIGIIGQTRQRAEVSTRRELSIADVTRGERKHIAIVGGGFGAMLSDLGNDLMPYWRRSWRHHGNVGTQQAAEWRSASVDSKQATGSAVMPMNASVVSALAALVGAAIGGLTSVIATWLTQRTQARAQRCAREQIWRQQPSKEFIEEASKCYIDALQHDKADIPGLIGLYAKIGRMRVLSSRPIIESAEHIARKILDAYLEPDKTFVELRDMASSGAIDLLRDFSDACRTEFESLRGQQL
jgi:hypothetical protein